MFFFSYYYGIRVTEGTLGEVFTEAVTVANDSIAIFEYNPEYYLYPIYPQLQMHTSEWIKSNYATIFFSEMVPDM